MDPVAPAPKFKMPLLATVIGPAAAVVMVLLKAKAFPVRLIPATAVVLRAPLNVVVPVPTSWLMNVEATACVDTLLALVMVKPVRGVPIVPTSPFNEMDPVPAFRFRL